MWLLVSGGGIRRGVDPFFLLLVAFFIAIYFCSQKTREKLRDDQEIWKGI